MPKRAITSKTRQRRSRKQPESKNVGAQERESPLEESDPKKSSFKPETLDRTVIAIPLLNILKEDRRAKKPRPHSVIIDLNLEFPGGRIKARQYVRKKIEELIQASGDEKDSEEGIVDKIGVTESGTPDMKGGPEQYIFAKLMGDTICRLVTEDGRKDDGLKNNIIGNSPFARAIYHVWPDFRIKRLTNKSIVTVKANAAQVSFSAYGEGIVWAVLDSGIDANHRHFKLHKNLELAPPLVPMDFTGEKNPKGDPDGHGTHVAGIIAGEVIATVDSTPNKKLSRAKRKGEIRAASRNRTDQGDTSFSIDSLPAISGMAPKCKLLNMRVLDSNGGGEVSSIIAAIHQIQEINGYGRRLLIHGVNLSVGNDFEPEWFACGQSPLCVEVDRLIKSGVVVVVAAGNSGYGSLKTMFTETFNTSLALTINDPGNAELAITVGSTHRSMPHTYGVSYFSSKGPTGDGRLKPDVVAPGEKIISCAAGGLRQDITNETREDCDYVENSGTSMAAPHVSGIIAAFLSVRREFIGQPERVKEIFLSTTTDLRRDPYFQGRGLVDLMRAIQSV
ncbi:MAG TPA: S8 family peptidase [Blastocatellia bacterium]|nr:S8 family peptidase [Blastocatellia bacterium]